MKSENLKKLSDAGFNVPRFTVVEKGEIISLDFFEEEVQLFAVRSSFSREDGVDFSFAGQFDTLLEVKREDVLKAVRNVIEGGENKAILLASLNEEAGKFNKEDIVNGTMRVIIQEMICADYSGVVFTKNPQGILNEVVAIIGSGRGDQVVEEKAEVTTYYYNRDDEIYFYEKCGSAPILEGIIFRKLMDEVLKIEVLFGYACDVEFAIKDGEIYILQARPITTLNYEKELVLDNSNIVESYPEINLPITQSFAKEVYYRVFKSCVLLVSSPKVEKGLDGYLREMVTSVNGRIYYNINHWYYLLKILPFSRKIIPIWRKMLGVEAAYVPKDEIKISFCGKFLIQFKFIIALIKTPKEMKKLNKFFEEALPKYKENLSEKTQASELLKLYNELLEEIGNRWGITLLNDMYTFIFTALSGKNKRAKINEIKGLESTMPITELKKLQCLLTDFGEESKEFKTGLAGYIDRYGDRGIEELKLETITFAMDPLALISYIKKEKIQEIPAVMSENRDGIFVKCAKLGMKNRETSRMNRSRAFGLARLILTKIGEDLVARELLEEKRDVFWLYLEEVEKIAGFERPEKVEKIAGFERLEKVEKIAEGKEEDYKKLIRERKNLYKGYEKLPTINRYVFADEIVQKQYGNINEGEISFNKTNLVGTPCSKGIARGEVLVLESADLLQDTKGKILVTKSTDPGWIFLIQNAAGIISEKGTQQS